MPFVTAPPPAGTRHPYSRRTRPVLAALAAAAIAVPALALAVPAASAASPAQAPVVASALSSGAHTVAAPAAKSHRIKGKIKGVVGPDFVIKVRPRTITAGKYKLIVKDKGTIHNFHITGPGGVDEATSVPGTGKTVWKIKFVEGTYDIVCDPHSDMMHTTLTVT